MLGALPSLGLEESGDMDGPSQYHTEQLHAGIALLRTPDLGAGFVGVLFESERRPLQLAFFHVLHPCFDF